MNFAASSLGLGYRNGAYRFHTDPVAILWKSVWTIPRLHTDKVAGPLISRRGRKASVERKKKPNVLRVQSYRDHHLLLRLILFRHHHRLSHFLQKMTGERAVHPDCRNAGNPYHECSEYCFKIIAEAKKNEPAPLKEVETRSIQPTSVETPVQENNDLDDHPSGDDKIVIDEVAYAKLTGKQKKLFDLRLKINEAKKANQIAMVAEKKRKEAPEESRGISKQKWMEERKKKIGKLLDANGLDIKKAYMLDTQQMAETKYKKWDKASAPAGWDVFNQKTLYDAYKKRTKKMEVDLEEYNKMKEADPEFYREASSLQYGKAPKVSDDKVERMVKELKDRDEKKNTFSRRRRFHEEKDIDSINDRNEHFNKKIERAFGRYTLEIKNNLERGTALPD